MGYRVPFVDAKAHYARIKPEIDAAIIDTISAGDLVYRSQLKDFEINFARFVHAEHAVGLNSGYHALLFALLACDIGEGDEVITAGHTFLATVSAIVHSGATPVLVDVRADYNIDPAAVEAAITPRTRAILPVHLNGRMSDMKAIMAIAEKHGLLVIEDAAQAIGATHHGKAAGATGAAGCFSFYPFKVLGGLGDGGALTSNDPTIARFASLYRYNGEDRETGDYHYHGQTALLDNLQAAVLDVKLRHLPSWLDHRRAIAARYRSALDGIDELGLPHFPGEEYHDVFQNYVVRTTERDALREHLRAAGVETLVHWERPMWAHPALGLKDPGCKETETICKQVISLPMSAETTDEHVDITAEAIRDFFSP